jgi:hypothetical protein
LKLEHAPLSCSNCGLLRPVLSHPCSAAFEKGFIELGNFLLRKADPVESLRCGN